MAGVTQNVVVSSESVVFEQDVSSSDSLSFTINSAETASLQDLIDSELALRISTEMGTADAATNVNVLNPDIDKDTNRQFIINEREHTALHTVNNNEITNANMEIVCKTDNANADFPSAQQPIIPLEPNVVVETPGSDTRLSTPDAHGGNLLIDIADFNSAPVEPVSNDEKQITVADVSIATKVSDISVLDPFDAIVEDNSASVCDDVTLVTQEVTRVQSDCMADTNNIPITPKLTDVDEGKGDGDVKRSSSLSSSPVEPVVPVFKDTLLPAADNDDFDTWTTVADATKEEVLSPAGDSSPLIIVEESELVQESSKKTEDATAKEALVIIETETVQVSEPHRPNELIIIEQTDVSGNNHSPAARDQVDASPVSVPVHALCEPVDSNDSKSDTETSESVTSEKKTVKKKKSSEGGETTATRTKKTKKTKKSEEKENHISVKQTYCSEAAKTLSKVTKPSEEPVAAPVPIRELRRSFGDLHKACENAELTALEPPPITNAQAASYWSLVNHESSSPPFASSSAPSWCSPASPSSKSSFSKFDQLQKKTLLHVRSSDSARAQKTFGGSPEPLAPGTNPSCKSCGKTVFAMEQIKAERSVWHKNCFRCNECNKQLTLDIYSSHEGVLYCKPHFRELFKPKAVVENEDEPVRLRRPEMIIRENQPLELPPDVVRASDKPDLGLDELNSLNVKSRFQAFEKTVTENGHDSQPVAINVKRSPSILSKLAKFQKKGMDIGVTDESLNGVDYEESSSSSEEEDEDGVVRSTKAIERPTAFGKMEDVKRSWESGQARTKEERLEERKQEKQSIRSRLFMGKQGKMKEMYEQAVAESEGRGGSAATRKELDAVRSDKARVVRERFERGEVVLSDSEEEGEKTKLKEQEDMSIFEAGISKKSRSLFLEMDANVAKNQQSSPVSTPPVQQPHQPQNNLDSTRRARDTESPDREIYRDPAVVRSEDRNDEEDTLVKRSQTTSKMLSIFRQMEEAKETVPDGPKPLKRFTPPPDYKEEEESEEEEDEDEESEEEEETEEDSTTGIVRASDKVEDEFLKQAQNAAKAKALKEKFEHWEPERQSKNNAINMLDSDQASLDSTKSLRARFESLKSEQPQEKSRPKVNRFVEPAQPMSTCAVCDKIVYFLERVETNGKLFHKTCFRCSHGSCVLRMETYTLNNGQLYCLSHFKQLFIAKGNYDEGFGSDQHKRKWEAAIVNGTH